MSSMVFTALYDGLQYEVIAGDGEQIAQVLKIFNCEGYGLC